MSQSEPMTCFQQTAWLNDFDFIQTRERVSLVGLIVHRSSRIVSDDDLVAGQRQQ